MKENIRELLAVLSICILSVALCSCSTPSNIYEYATAIQEADLIVCEDGTVWKLTDERISPYDGSEIIWGTVEFVRNIEQGEMTCDTDKTNTSDMALWEFALATIDEGRVAVGQDGRVWMFGPKELQENRVWGWVPVDVPEDLLNEDFSVTVEKIAYSERGDAFAVVSMQDNTGDLISPSPAYIEVLIGGQWYRPSIAYPETGDVKFFDENGRYTRVSVLATGDNGDIPLPSGHYRINAIAYPKVGANVGGWEERQHAIAEFDLLYKNGEYSIVCPP